MRLCTGICQAVPRRVKKIWKKPKRAASEGSDRTSTQRSCAYGFRKTLLWKLPFLGCILKLTFKGISGMKLFRASCFPPVSSWPLSSQINPHSYMTNLQEDYTVESLPTLQMYLPSHRLDVGGSKHLWNVGKQLIGCCMTQRRSDVIRKINVYVRTAG
jgi:hypothetical protein